MTHPKPYIRKKVAEFRSRRRAYAKKKLGGKCVECGGEKELEFDHVDPATKVATIAKMWTAAKERFDEEIEKCQLLCNKCHKDKTATEPNTESWNKGKWTHGSLTGYVGKKCRCYECKAYYAKYRKNKRMGECPSGSKETVCKTVANATLVQIQPHPPKPKKSLCCNAEISYGSGTWFYNERMVKEGRKTREEADRMNVHTSDYSPHCSSCLRRL